MLDQVRAWLKGEPAPGKTPDEKAPRTKEKAESRTGGRPAAKPVLEAVGQALAAIGDLLISIRARKEAAAAKRRKASPSRKKRATTSRAKRARAAEARTRAESRRAAVSTSNGTVHARPSATVDGVATPVSADRTTPLS